MSVSSAAQPIRLEPELIRRPTHPGRRVLAALVLGALPALVLAVAVVSGGTRSPWVLPLALLTVMVNVGVILADIRYGLALFIVAAGLSPKLPGLYNNLRVEDFVFALVFLIWVLRYAGTGKLPSVRSPMVLPFLFITGLSLISTVYGFMLGQVPDVKYSIFLQLKRVEYFLIFWIVATTIRSEAWLRVLCLTFVASGALAAGYGLIHAEEEVGSDVGARVQGPEGENYNTLSGYLVVCIGAGLALLPAFRQKIPRALLIAGTAISAMGLLASFSREGYIMLVGTLLVFGLAKQRWILALAVFGVVLAVTASPQVRERVMDTVDKIQNAQTGDPGSNSLTARFRAWEYRYNGWFVKQPILGNGVGSVALSIDNEYLLRACEVGLIGLSVFVWWLYSIWQQIRRTRRDGGIQQLLALGTLAGFVGLLIQGMVGASFTTIRTMEPFWFLLGLLVAAGVIYRRQAAAAAQAAEAAVPAGPAPAPAGAPV